ncbi:MAG: bifunctional transaldolase/phosoglucose isomerase [Anaerolineales bacterium]
MNSIQKLTALGQSLWYDNIQRRLLENGELAALIARGDIRGVTSNPTIFHNAISKSSDYDSALIPLAQSGWSAEDIFWQLAVEDIQAACDLFAPLYKESLGVDGYVSLEVSPALANDTDGTLAQAKALWARVNRPNLMIKIPATLAGLPAIRAAIAAGINVNVTLIFSVERYRAVMDAYISGLEDRLLAGAGKASGAGAGKASGAGAGKASGAGAGKASGAGGTIENIHSVASFFVSRIDSKIDPKLPQDSPLRGKAAIANAKLAYEAFQQVFSDARFGKLQLAQANYQRPLWASTGTKNPAYSDTLYVDGLIGPATVNTVPPATLDAFREHGTAAETINAGLDEAKNQLAALEKLGISMQTVTAELEAEGVKSFAEAFSALLASVEARRKSAVEQLGPLQAAVSAAVQRLQTDSAPARLWAHDPTLWTQDPAGQAEVKIRLGWLTLPETMRPALAEMRAFAEEVHAAGINKALLLGMGGSSLAPEVLSLVFNAPGFAILDSTDPGQVREAMAAFPPAETLYIVSSKSGGTAEVMSAFENFWSLADGDGSHFIAITDPGTSLEKLAQERGFRKVFNADPMVGGRYSALTAFGLVPAALMKLDLERMLSRAGWMMRECAAEKPAARNPGLVLGAILGQAALAGRDKLTILADDVLAPAGAWLEQLMDESSGKNDKGILIVDGEPHFAPEFYGSDRIFAYLRLDGQHDAFAAALRAAGQPVLEFRLEGRYDLFAEMYRWEVATAIACAEIGVNAFDQPDVQIAKDIAKKKIAEYREKGKLGTGKFIRAADAPAALKQFLAQAKPGDYLAINAYLRRNPAMNAALQELRERLAKQSGLPTTLGFGPRFLHSTGQLHKGGANNGLFLQITADAAHDLDIPGQGMSFGTLELAQALGDYDALEARGRRILRIHLTAPENLQSLL